MELFAELILQLVIEMIVNSGAHAFRGRPNLHPLIAALVHLLFGAALGGFSLLLFQESFIESNNLKLINLIATPVLIGCIMALIGRARLKKDKEVIRMEKFFYGFLFAFGLALIRFLFAG